MHVVHMQTRRHTYTHKLLKGITEIKKSSVIVCVYVYAYVCVFVYLCMFVCICMYVCVHVSVYVCVHVMCICMCTCVMHMYVCLCVCVHLYTAVDSKKQNWTLAPLHSRLFPFPRCSRIITIKLLPYGKNLVKLQLPGLSNNVVRTKCKLGGLW